MRGQSGAGKGCVRLGACLQYAAVGTVLIQCIGRGCHNQSAEHWYMAWIAYPRDMRSLDDSNTCNKPLEQVAELLMQNTTCHCFMGQVGMALTKGRYQKRCLCTEARLCWNVKRVRSLPRSQASKKKKAVRIQPLLSPAKGASPLTYCRRLLTKKNAPVITLQGHWRGWLV